VILFQRNLFTYGNIGLLFRFQCCRQVFQDLDVGLHQLDNIQNQVFRFGKHLNTDDTYLDPLLLFLEDPDTLVEDIVDRVDCRGLKVKISASSRDTHLHTATGM